LQDAAGGKAAALLAQPASLKKALHDFSMRLLEYECGFYNDYCRNEPAHRFLQNLRRDSESIYLDLGFGTGWHSKTIGMAFEGKELWDVRKKYGMNDRGPDEYPKTRKWAKTPDGYLPLGWIKLEII
jgi:CRISPR/Cas system CSM-associated protein Csm5 (group 7 of RAMP superfamily)